MNTKKILGIAAVTLLVAVALVGAASATGVTEKTWTDDQAYAAGYSARVGAEQATSTWYFPTVAEAIANVSSGETITLTHDANSDGFVVNKVETTTIDLNNHKLTLGASVGSVGTVTQGISVYKDYTLNLKNGTIDIGPATTAAADAKKSDVCSLIINYGTLDLKGVTLDCTTVGSDWTRYTASGKSEPGSIALQIVSGSVTIDAASAIKAKDATYAAINVVNSSGTYADPTTLSWKGATITGKVIVLGTETDIDTKAFGESTSKVLSKGSYAGNVYAWGDAYAVIDAVLANETPVNLSSSLTIGDTAFEVAAGETLVNPKTISVPYGKTLNVNGNLENNGTLYNDSINTINVGATGNLVNNGEFSNDGSLNNAGDFTNNGIFTNFDGFTNACEFANNGTFTNGDEFINTGDFTNNSTIINEGALNNSGSFINSTTGVFTDNGDFASTGEYKNYGTVNGENVTYASINMDTEVGQGHIIVNNVAVTYWNVPVSSILTIDDDTVTVANSTIRAVAASGYKFSDFTVSGGAVSAGNNQYKITGEVTLKATFTANADTTVVNAFYYVTGYNDSILTPGYVYVDANGNSFNVPSETVEDWYLTPEAAPAGTYFHMIGTGASEYDQMVYVSPAKLSYSNISESTVYIDETGKGLETIKIQNASDIKPALIFEKADTEGVFVNIPGVTCEYDGKLGTFTLNVEKTSTSTIDYNDYKGTWNVYADFSKTYDESSSTLFSDSVLYEKTPAEYKYVLVGSFKIAADKADVDSSLTVSTNEITDGNVFSVTVNTEKGSKVTVEYYEETETSDDAVTVTETSDKFFYVAGQAAYDGNGKFNVPATGVVTIGIQSNVKALTDKTYHFEVTCSETATEKKGGSDNPLTFDMKVKGNTFTANLAKTEYVKGENVTVEGSYSNTDENFKPYVYVEGTNTAFFAPSYAVKYKNTVASPNKTIKDGEYTLVFDASNFNELNAGTYTVYVSKEICNEIANATSYTSGDAYNQYQLVYDETSETYTNGVSKIKTVENAKVLTLVLKESMIKITDISREVQAGSNANTDKGYYLRATVEAEGTDRVSFYVVGQNKLFYIDGDDAKQNGYVKTLSKNNPNYLYAETDETGEDNKYWYETSEGKTLADEKSVVKVAQKLGVWDTDYPMYLIIDNEDGTFTVYIHIQATDEENDYEFDTKLGLGQYYLVAQHPMADGIFNAFAGYVDSTGAYIYDESENVKDWVAAGDAGYTSGANVYKDNIFQFNVPAVQNLTAAQKVIETIEAAGDAQNGKDFYVVATAEDAQVINAPEASYKQGEIITIVVENATIGDFNNGTLEANTFDFSADNLNYIQTFAVVAKENKNTGLETVTFTLDTSEVPGGDYKIILRDDTEVKKVYDTKIIATTTPVIEVSVSIAGASSLTVGDTTVLTAKNSDGSTGVFKWTSSDANVASVDENGNVVAKKAGTVTITVENTVTGKTATKTIVVADQSTPVTPTPTTTPGFGILAALAGLGAVAALVLRRK